MCVCNIYVWKENLDWLLLGFLHGIVILLSETAASAFSFLIRSTSPRLARKKRNVYINVQDEYYSTAIHRMSKCKIQPPPRIAIMLQITYIIP